MSNPLSVITDILKYTQLATVGVIAAEQTLTEDTGATKQQKVLDVVATEAQAANIAVPGIAPSIVNIIVGIFNIAGLFHHKATTPAS